MIQLSPALQTSLAENQLIKFKQYQLIQISGNDRLGFLHNQFTNDLKNLAKQQTSLSAWCSIKGRVLATFRIWSEGEHYFLLIPTPLADTLIKRLRMFVLRSDVQIKRLKEKSIYGLIGQDLEQLSLPADDNSYMLESNNTLIKIAAPVDRYLIISDDQQLQLDHVSTSTAVQHWQLLDILAAIPEVLNDSVDEYLPQMLNLEQLGGLSFQKGCYPGQEIVARVRYRGELKKQLYRGYLVDAELSEINPGMNIINQQGTSVGKILTATTTSESNWAILAVINIEQAQTHSLHLATASKPMIVLCDTEDA